MRYKRRRLVVKACIWELMSFLWLGSLVYFVTRKWEVVTPVVIAYHLVKIGAFYFYDKRWHGVKWGRIDD